MAPMRPLSTARLPRPVMRTSHTRVVVSCRVEIYTKFIMMQCTLWLQKAVHSCDVTVHQHGCSPQQHCCHCARPHLTCQVLTLPPVDSQWARFNNRDDWAATAARACLVASGEFVAVGVPRDREAVVEVPLQLRDRLAAGPVQKQRLGGVAHRRRQAAAARARHRVVDRPRALQPAA